MKRDNSFGKKFREKKGFSQAKDLKVLIRSFTPKNKKEAESGFIKVSLLKDQSFQGGSKFQPQYLQQPQYQQKRWKQSNFQKVKQKSFKQAKVNVFKIDRALVMKKNKKSSSNESLIKLHKKQYSSIIGNLQQNLHSNLFQQKREPKKLFPK